MHTRFYYRDPDAPEPPGPRQLGVIALIERDGSILLERRVDAPLWGPIAGRVEDDESLVEALRREVQEETGLTLRSFELFGTFSDPTRIVRYRDGNTFRFASFAYLVEVESFAGLRTSDESEELRFFPRSELLSLDLPATHRRLFELLVAGTSPPHLE